MIEFTSADIQKLQKASEHDLLFFRLSQLKKYETLDNETKANLLESSSRNDLYKLNKDVL